MATATTTKETNMTTRIIGDIWVYWEVVTHWLLALWVVLATFRVSLWLVDAIRDRRTPPAFRGMQVTHTDDPPSKETQDLIDAYDRRTR